MCVLNVSHTCSVTVGMREKSDMCDICLSVPLAGKRNADKEGIILDFVTDFVAICFINLKSQ